MSYVNPTEAAKYYGVCTATLRDWANQGKIKYIKTNGNHRRYKLPDPKTITGKCYIYARVSSKKQESDLQRQIDFIKKEYKDYEVIKDIGSGLNFKRQGFREILKQLFENKIKEVVVSSSDRFSRFGTRDYFGWLFSYFGGKLTILEDKQYESPDEELAKDLLEIVTVFSARHYGRRSYSNDRQDNREDILY
jgi:excisionase family DNA binding protein